MEDLRAGDLAILASAPTEGTLRLDWSGASNDRQPEAALEPYFARALDAAPSGGIEMHFEQLDHFNSLTVNALIQLIHGARQRGLKLVLHFDPARRWQKLAFGALKALEKGDGLVEIRGA